MIALIQQYAAYAMIFVGGVGLAAHYGSWAISKFGNIKLPTIGAAPPDDDTNDFQALARLQHRFERLNCKEGIDACTTCLTHFFHGHPGQP